jgi:hypothetical protein
MIKYFHELTADEYKKLVGKITWADLSRDYPQPPWCNYSDAAIGIMGCWSLTSHIVSSEKFCEGCECHKAQKEELVL